MGALLTIIPGLASGLVGLVICIPVFIRQFAQLKLQAAPKAAEGVGP